MGLLDRWKYRKQNVQEVIPAPEPERNSSVIEAAETEAVPDAIIVPAEFHISSITDCCEQMQEAKRQIDDVKTEYEAVTSYLTDIQNIEGIPAEDRAVLETAARNILILNKEREKYKNSEVKLTKEQISTMERHEATVPREVRLMKENEEYSMVIKNDLRQLNGERGRLQYERQELYTRQRYLKKISIVITVLVASLLTLITALSYAFEKDMAVPYILSIAMGALGAFYIFMEAGKNRREMELNGRKLNRAIGLLNKVKIKYVNNTSLLEYSYDKFCVNSWEELEYVWKQYVILKENEQKYRMNMEKLRQEEALLVQELERFHIRDTDVWKHQAEAILDKREMVEVRHRLNVRRQKLRERLDYNTKLYNQNRSQIQKSMAEKPQYRDEIVSITHQYGITL